MPKTITPATALPSLTGVVTINGTTQGGWVSAPIIELNGGVTAGADGLNLQGGSDGSTIRGLVINRFDASAIALFSANNVIVGKLPGHGPLGHLGRAPTQSACSSANSGNRVGGTVPADRNIISANTVDGIQILGSANNSSRATTSAWT